MDALAQQARLRVHCAWPELARLLHGGRNIDQVGIEDTGLGGIKRQLWDIDHRGIAYAVGFHCGHVATSICRVRRARSVEPDDELAEVAPLQHADKGLRRLLQPFDEVLAIPDAAVGDAGADLPQESGKVLGCKAVVDEASHREALRQDRVRGGGQEVGAVARSDGVILCDQARNRDTPTC
jgi:hypothetical protein